MMNKKCTTSALLYLLIAVIAVSLIGLLPVRQALLINVWSVEYTRHAFNPISNQSALTVLPIGHAHAALWLASDALQADNPSLAETLLVSQVAQGEVLAMHFMADVRMAEGDFAGSVAIWQQIGDYSELRRAATQAEQAGRLEEALLAFEAAWVVDPESSTLPLTDILINSKKDYGRAENVLRKSLADFPNSRLWPDWLYRLGTELRRQRRWDEATTIYKRAIVSTPDAWKAHLGLGWVKYERGDGFQEAMSEFQQVINSPESQGNGQFAIAQLMTRENRFKEADAWFNEAFELDPRNWYWNLARGNAARQSGNLELALSVYQETLELFPDKPSIYSEMAYAYKLDDQSTKAIIAIEQAIVLVEIPNVYYFTRAGVIYEWVGDVTKAVNVYRQALLIDPQNAAALRGVERLEKTRSSPLN